MSTVIGLDIGSTKISAALAYRDGRPQKLLRHRIEDPDWTAEKSLQRLHQMVADLRAKAEASRLQVGALGVGFGGPVDYAAGRVRVCLQTPGWNGLPIVQEFEDRHRLPVVLDNDANAGGLGEMMYGAGRGHRDVLYVNVGTGVGGAAIIGGTVHHGSTGITGEIGHMILDPDGPPCTCGGRGCLEALAAGPGIARRGNELRGRSVTSEEVFGLAAGGEEAAKRVVDETARWLGQAIANAANLISPEMVILGGGVSEAGDLLFDPLRGYVKQFAFAGVADDMPVVPAELGYDAGVRGAIALAWQHLDGLETRRQ